MTTLTEEQQAHITAIAASDKAVDALTGYAGTGKTTCLPYLVDALKAQDQEVVIAAPTNKAACVLRSRGLESATTYYRAAFRPVPTQQFKELSAWIGPKVAKAYGNEAEVDIGTKPELVTKTPDARIRAAIFRHSGQSPTDVETGGAATEMGCSPASHMEWVPKTSQSGVLIVDEASMLDLERFAELRGIYDRIILVGDPGQLPPVKGGSALETVEPHHLTQIQRQAQDSGICRFAHAVRNGTPLIDLLASNDVQVAQQFSPQRGPIIVWRNDRRVSLTTGIRKFAGRDPNAPEPGELMVCRTESALFKDMGLIKNGIYEYQSPTEVIAEDGAIFRFRAPIFVEELHPVDTAPRQGECAFRFAYAMTAHTAQGSEWPAVQVDWNEYVAYRRKKPQEAERWLYTAATRAKKVLYLIAKGEPPIRQAA
jgi:exodeoxyribonuclease V